MNNSAINKAQETLEYLSQDPVARAKYEARQKYILDYNTSMYTERQEGRIEGIEEGIEIGEKRNSLLIAKKMRELGASLEFVMQSTGLTSEELEEL